VVLRRFLVNDEVRKSMTVKIKPSIQREARHTAIELGKTLGRWNEDAIEEKIKREQGKVK